MEGLKLKKKNAAIHIKVLVISIFTICIVLVSACTVSKNKHSNSETNISENASSYDEHNTEGESVGSESQKEIVPGQNYNHFTVQYDDLIFYMSTDGIHKLNGDGTDELFYPVKIYNVNLFLYDSRLYFYGIDRKIHSVGIENCDETILADGVVTCEFNEDYLFTFLPNNNGSLEYEYVAYEFQSETGEVKSGTPLKLIEIYGTNERPGASTIMNTYSDIQYTDGSNIVNQKIAIINPLISSQRYNGIYYYVIEENGMVSIQFENSNNTEPYIYYQKDLSNILNSDLKPIWSSIITGDGIIFSELYSDISLNTGFPIYYAEKEQDKKVIVDHSENRTLGQLMNFSDNWVYYTASDSESGAYGCYRANIVTLEEECLYSTNIDILGRQNTADIQDGQLFYWDYEKNKVKVINLME